VVTSTISSTTSLPVRKINTRHKNRVKDPKSEYLITKEILTKQTDLCTHPDLDSTFMIEIVRLKNSPAQVDRLKSYPNGGERR
jgi:hypothetical protein